jgi:SAM-dependent methyltransferase
MSNLYGYSDYHGPGQSATTATSQSANNVVDDEVNPLQTGFWMEGDSLAPPCGTSLDVVHAILEFAQVCSTDVLYDLGCGDGRVCLEAFSRHGCKTVGVEVEEDLVERARELASRIKTKSDAETASNGQSAVDNDTGAHPQFVQADLRDVLDTLIQQATQTDKETSNSSSLPMPTVIILYLLPDSLESLQSLFERLVQSTRVRVVCNTWGFADLVPVQKASIKQDSGIPVDVYMYTCESITRSLS